MNAPVISICVIFSILNITWFSIDTRSRIKDEKKRKHHHNPWKFIPSWAHTQVSLIYFISTVLIWFISYYYLQQDINQNAIYQLIIALLFIVIFLLNLYMAVRTAAKFLFLQYGQRRNPLGLTIFFIASAILIANWIIFVVGVFYEELLSFHWSYYRFSTTMFASYLLFAIILDTIYFHAAYIAVFENDSYMNNIDFFVTGLVRPVFYFTYVIMRYIVIIIIFSVNNYKNEVFWLYVFPFLMTLLSLSLFFARKQNRPKQCACAMIHFWRPFVEFWWKIAANNYKKRNPDAPASKLKAKWKNNQISSEKKEVKQDENGRKIDERRQLVRAISQHADL